MIYRVSLLLTFITLLYLDGVTQTFQIDKGHTNVSFEVNRFGTVNVSGRFDDFSGQLTYDATENVVKSVSFSIVVNSLNTGHEIRDGHLLGEMWLDADSHKKINFECENVVKGPDGFTAIGKLTIRGVSQDVRLPFEIVGPFVDPTKKNTIGVALNASINRQDYGITFSKLMDNGALFIGNQVNIRVNALFQQ